MRNVLIVLVLFSAACSPTKESADLLVVNANAYTVDSNFSKTETFAVKDGKFADFTVFSDDLMEVPITQVPEIKAEQTFIAGKRVH